MTILNSHAVSKLIYLLSLTLCTLALFSTETTAQTVDNITATTHLVGRIAVEWDSLPNTSHYFVYIGDSADDVSCEENPNYATYRFIHIPANDAILAGNQFFYRIKAVSNNGTIGDCGAPSNAGRAIHYTVPPDVQVSLDYYEQQVNFTIDPFDYRVTPDRYADFNKLLVYRTTNPNVSVCTNFHDSFVGWPPPPTGNAFSRNDVDVTSGQLYFYSFRYYYYYQLPFGRDEWYSNCTENIAGRALLPAPDNFSAEDQVDDTRVRLLWESQPLADGFVIYRSTTSTPACDPQWSEVIEIDNVEVNNVYTNTYDDHPPQNSTAQYQYGIRTRTGSNLSSSCSTDTGQMAPPGFIPPHLQASTDAGYDLIVLLWSYVEQSGYNLYENKDCSGRPLFTTSLPQDRSYFHQPLSPNTSVWYSVNTINEFGEVSGCSEPVLGKTSNVHGDPRILQSHP